MDFATAFKTDISTEEKGRWFEFGDVELLIARSQNRTYTDMMSQQFQAHNHTLSQKDTKEQREAANERAEKIQVDVMAASVLLGWRGRKVADDSVEGGFRTGKVLFEGEDITDAYSQLNAKKLLAMKDFRSWVNTKADDFKNYLAEVKKADEKN